MSYIKLSSILFCGLLFSTQTRAAESAQAMATPASQDTSFEAVSTLPEQDALPDPFLRPDGKRVQTLTQWQQQREYLKAMLAHYMNSA